jgi:hypothetical protein
VLSTILVYVFAAACLSTFICGADKRWVSARRISAGIAILSFLLALLFAVKR